MVGSLFSPTSLKGEEVTNEKLDLWESVVPLTTTTSFMNTGAHPDDERSHFLAYLSRGQGVQTSFLLSTRGQGGQNEIGSELGNELGIIRTNELQASSNVLGIETFFLNQGLNDSVKDFGFSKSAEETLNKWGETKTYERLIHYIRQFKPDIIMPSFRNVDTQHGHHRAMTMLTKKAFKDAANPDVFPDQLDNGLSTWQAKKMYLPAETEEQTTTSIQIGINDTHYDMTYPQLGEKARYLHESQGMGKEVGDGEETVNLQLVKSTVGDIPEHEDTIFENIPYDFNDHAKSLTKSENAYKNKLIRLQKDLEAVKDAYPNAEKVFTEAKQTLDELQKLKSKMNKGNKLEAETKKTLLHKLEVKEKQLVDTIYEAAQIDVNVQVNDSKLTDRDETKVSVKVENNGTHNIEAIRSKLSIPADWKMVGDQNYTTLKSGENTTFHYKVKTDINKYYNPYNNPAIQANITLKVGNQFLTKQYKPNETVAQLPEVSLTLEPEKLVINTNDVKESTSLDVQVEKFAEGDLTTEVSLNLPKGWKAEPNSKTVRFNEDEENKQVSFELIPPPTVAEGDFTITPKAKVGNKIISESVQTIQYEHIGTDYSISDAKVEGTAFPLDYPNDLKVGYVDSGFDKVAEQLTNIGMDITKLNKEQLQNGDLSKYDTIVTGIRAYLSREDLLNNNKQLLEYVENGGHLVVQYNKPWDNWDPQATAPYKLVIGQPSIKWRVTHEDAPIEVLKPDSPLFNYPNSIKQSDWEGWVQERGLYFPMEWSDKYETYVSVADPGEDAFKSGILMADYGEGSYLYSNLVWYRQIQNQVPGGYRIFTNLISYPYHDTK